MTCHTVDTKQVEECMLGNIVSAMDCYPRAVESRNACFYILYF